MHWVLWRMESIINSCMEECTLVKPSKQLSVYKVLTFKLNAGLHRANSGSDVYIGVIIFFSVLQ